MCETGCCYWKELNQTKYTPLNPVYFKEADSHNALDNNASVQWDVINRDRESINTVIEKALIPW